MMFQSFILLLQMVAPRSLDELAGSLEWEEGTTDWTGGVRGRVSSGSAPWVRAFLATPRMKEAGREGLFLYMLCCSGIGLRRGRYIQ